jgi:hypothetical protein
MTSVNMGVRRTAMTSTIKAPSLKWSNYSFLNQQAKLIQENCYTPKNVIL